MYALAILMNCPTKSLVSSISLARRSPEEGMWLVTHKIGGWSKLERRHCTSGGIARQWRTQHLHSN
jgi:hypothetical protein